MRATIAGTTVDPEIARLQQHYAGVAFDIVIDRIEPKRLFSFRWHPGAADPGYNYSAEPMTLVVFTLDEAPGGVLLTVTESGFDQIPLARRAAAFSANEGGWAIQMRLVNQYVTNAS